MCMSCFSSLLPESIVFHELLHPSQKVPQAMMQFPLTAPQPTAQSSPLWKFHKQGNQSTRHHMPQGYLGTPHPFPMEPKNFHTFLVDPLQPVAYFQTVFSNGLSLSFVGEIWVLETINVYWTHVCEYLEGWSWEILLCITNGEYSWPHLSVRPILIWPPGLWNQ